MGLAIPQVITPGKASGAQVIDGSLKFDSDAKTYITRTPGSAGNRKKFTYSCWLKRFEFGSEERFLEIAIDGNNQAGIKIQTNNQIQFFDYDNGAYVYNLQTDQVFRDTGWYHIVYAVDTTQNTSSDRVKIYVNGTRVVDFSTETYPSQNVNARITNSQAHEIGRYGPSDAQHLGARMSQVYLIDGLQLGPEYFGFTDPLTNTWKPKKYVNTTASHGDAAGVVGFGTNGFYLPMDGNSPIGQDQSGQGNDFTPVRFGGSVALDNPQVSGARPILNTTQGGTAAGIGVFGSKQNVGYAVTVYNDGGGNKYYIDGVKQATLTGLIRGATYTFDTTDSSNSGHPFRFSESDGGSEYTNGVAAITGTATTITIPYNSSNDLYYYCTNHSGMGSSITGITTNEKLADQYASNCILALPMLSNRDDSVSVACTSSTKAVTNSNVTINGISHFYGGSSLFNSSSDYYRLASSPFDYGNGDFTMEFWCYLDGDFDTARHVISAWQDGGNQTFYLGTGGANGYWGSFGVKIGGTQYEVNGDATKGRISQNGWHHIAGVRDGTNIKLFVDGNLIGTTACTSGSMISLPTYVYIGKHYSASGYEWEGNLSDLRIYKGVAKYTDSFIPASTDPDILPDTPSGVSGGSKLAKITDGAVSFDNSGDSLTVADHADFDLGTNSFTIECFAYLQTIGQFNNIFAVGTDSSNGYRLDISTSNNLRLLAQIGGSWSTVITGGTALASNKWYHLVVTRSGNNFDLWVDGIKDTTTVSNSGTITNPTTQLEIGRLTTNSLDRNFHGFISNLRFVNGTALYTSRFAPPTRELTNVTNTKLLCCQSNTLTGSAAVSPNISGINDGTVWSSTVTGPTRKEDRVANAFKGSSGSPGAIPAYPGTLRFEPGFTGISTLAVRGWYAGSGVSLHINGVAQSPSGGAYDIGITTTRLDSIVWTAVNGFNYYRIDQIEIDGVTLVDPVVGADDSNEAASTFNPFNTDINTVRGQKTGYPTWNPLSGQNIDLQDGNLDAESGTISSYATIPSTIPMTSGKWYAEFTYRENIDADGDGSNFFRLGISQTDRNFESGSDPLGTSKDFGWQGAGTLKSRTNGSASYTYTGNTVADGDILSLAFDVDAGKLWIARNGTYATNSSGTGDPVNGNNPDYSSLTYSGGYVFVAGPYAGAASPANGGGRLSASLVANFGQKPFKFAPPDGFQPLNLLNIQPENVIARPDQYFGVSLWTGNGTSQTISGLKHKPDFVWSKARSFGADHELYDSVRGTMQRLYSSLPNPEGSPSSGVNSFNADGFGVTGGGGVNNNTSTYVGWTWKAGGDKNTFNIDDVGYANASDVNMSVGALNSSVYNQSSVWTNDLTGTPYPSQTLSRLFDGTTSTGLIPNNGTSITFSPTGFSSISKLRIYGYSYTGNANGIRVNGNDYTNLFNTGGNYGGSSKWVTIPETHLSSIEWSINSNGLENGHLGAIEVDGKMLVDSGLTPANVPSIVPTGCSVNTKSKFGIYTYTGSGSGGGTLSHGLEGTPGLVIYKKRNSSSSWQVYHQSLGGTVYNTLDEDVGDYTSDSTRFGGTNPTASTITLGTHANGAEDVILYAWCDVPGLQKFGKWTGINNANGTFVELGFRPALVIAKESSATGSGAQWFMLDSSRNTYNPLNNILDANRGDGERQGVIYDFLSNGFKIRTSFNSGGTFIYMAWAEAPTVNLYGAQSNAR